MKTINQNDIKIIKMEKNIFNMPSKVKFLIDGFSFQYIMSSHDKQINLLEVSKEGEVLGTLSWTDEQEPGGANPVEFAYQQAINLINQQLTGGDKN